MKVTFYTAIVLVLTSLSLVASSESYTVKFSTYALRPLDTSSLYYLESPGSFTRLIFRKKSRSVLYQANIQTKDSSLHIYRKRQRPNEAAEYLPVGLAKVPQGDAQWLLLLTSDPADPDRVRAYAIEDSATNFPKGSIRVANITGVVTVGEINSTTISIPNGTITKAFQSGSGETFDIAVAAKGSNRYHLLYKNSIRITSGSRGLLILTPPIRKGSIRIGGHLLLESPNEVKGATAL